MVGEGRQRRLQEPPPTEPKRRQAAPARAAATRLGIAQRLATSAACRGRPGRCLPLRAVALGWNASKPTFSALKGLRHGPSRLGGTPGDTASSKPPLPSPRRDQSNPIAPLPQDAHAPRRPVCPSSLPVDAPLLGRAVDRKVHHVASHGWRRPAQGQVFYGDCFFSRVPRGLVYGTGRV